MNNIRFCCVFFEINFRLFFCLFYSAVARVKYERYDWEFKLAPQGQIQGQLHLVATFSDHPVCQFSCSLNILCAIEL